MLEIIAICTGNICRSPLAQLLLTTRLSDVGINVRSAGTRTRPGMRMPDEAAALASAGGVAPEEVATHRSNLLRESDLRSVDLILAMAREHRREVVELLPARVRNTFTLREIGYLAGELSDADLRAATRQEGSGAASTHQRFAAMLGLISARRGLSSSFLAPEDHDVVDPFGGPAATYQRAAEQMAPGLVQVERLVRLAHE